MLTAHIAEGAQVIFFDNVTRSVGCAPLDAMLTSPNWKDHVLGTSAMYSGRPNVTVVLTSNNAKVVGVTVRRACAFGSTPGASRSDNPARSPIATCARQSRKSAVHSSRPADHRPLASASQLAGACRLRSLGAGHQPSEHSSGTPRARSRREPGVLRETTSGRGRAPILSPLGRMVRRAGGPANRVSGLATCSQPSQ